MESSNNSKVGFGGIDSMLGKVQHSKDRGRSKSKGKGKISKKGVCKGVCVKNAVVMMVVS